MTLKELREQKGISQRKMALMLGICRDTLRQIENGKSSLKVKDLQKLSSIYKIKPYKLLDVIESEVKNGDE